MKLILSGSSDEMKEEFAENFFENVQKDNNLSQSVRFAEELFDILPYFWPSTEYLCNAKQDDEYLSGDKTLKQSTKDISDRLKSHFPRKALTPIMESIYLTEQSNEEDNAVNLLRGNLSRSGYPLGWLTLAELYAKRDSPLVFDTIKRGMLVIKDTEKKYPDIKLQWYLINTFYC